MAEHAPSRPTPEQSARMNEWGRPDRLHPGQLNPKLGTVVWPAALEAPLFASYRIQLEALFEARAPGNSGVGSTNYSQIQKVTRQMRHVLRELMQRMDTSEYIQAKNFLDSVAYESRFALEPGEEVAAR
jgi:hypothetical protein